MADPQREARDEAIWQRSLRRETQKDIAAAHGLTAHEVGVIVRRKRAERDERIWQASCRGFRPNRLATDFGLGVHQVEAILKRKLAELNRADLNSPVNVRNMRLELIWRVLPGVSQKVVDAADQSVLDSKGFDVGVHTFWLNLLEREARYVGADQTNVTVSGDPNSPVKIEGDTARLLQEFLKMALAAVEPFPGAGEAILQAMLGEGGQETGNA